MRKSLKLVFGLVPVVAGSAGTAIYLTSSNAISNLDNTTLARQTLQVETRLSPLSNSQDNETNQNSEELSTQEIVKNDETIVLSPEVSEDSQKSQPVKVTKNTKKPKIIFSNNQIELPKNSSNTQPKILLPQPVKKPVDETKKAVSVSKIQTSEKKDSSISVLEPQKPTNLEKSPSKSSEIVEKVVIIKQKPTQTEEKIQDSTPLTSPVVSNEDVKPVLAPKIVKTPEVIVISETPKVEHKEDTPKPKTQSQSDISKSTSSRSISPATTESEREVDEIIDKLQEDLKILLKSSVGENAQKYREAKKNLYKYVFKKNDQMRLFKERFPKTPITEEEAGFLYIFWENNYARFYPSLARSQTVRQNWKKELQKVLTITKTPEIGAFNRTTGGHVFIIDETNINSDKWIEAQPNSPSPKKS
ncbi:hypothetical protein R7V41_02090 [Mesomycoplasma ovipneumoniae]|uniref:Uncharacterized protein n=1 Tax=Mesomycoplasma ovipneumoniae TaxID=29562 RepID=A0AAJ2P9Q4_9BACT|nr:hypothetical protein [Mesomycoplasma ovipneumoniae]MDW2906404.1 hypothetical protein [Mesomycoplasma ovipneumoniae]MDW2914304.1 hypothetical protein [Mesomycoplasma ovipneumoniae]